MGTRARVSLGGDHSHTLKDDIMTTTPNNDNKNITYEQFCEEWLEDIENGDLSSLEKGRRFGSKLIAQWLEVTTDDEDFLVYDGAGDGGIDIAYLQRADSNVENTHTDSLEGDTWYLVQSKYGTSYTGTSTILEEGNKVLNTLQGRTQNLSEDIKHLLKKLDQFRKQTSEHDRIVLVFATTTPIAPDDREAIDRIKIIGREKIMANFDVEEVSLQTIWESLDDVEQARLSIPISGQFVEQTSGLLVGTVSLVELFRFLQQYQKRTGNLDQLYEKNVRQFLGGRRKINRGIAHTLHEEPEKFGLYNNGITIVVSGYSFASTERIVAMDDPYIVNGCQTTRTIWQVLDSKFNSGGTGNNDSATNVWKERVGRGGVVSKIVRSDAAEIINITRYTNSQNSVREQDFIALHSGFQNWKTAMAREYQIFLEIQRGGIDSRKAWEKQHPDHPKFVSYVNAFDLMKVYGAGWLGAPGLAFGKNAPFLPNGSVYERIVSRNDCDEAFGARDLYAAFKVKCAADKIGFGRNADLPSRRQSKFLFYYTIMQMLRNVILLTPQLESPQVSTGDLTLGILKLCSSQAENEFDELCKASVLLLDSYLTFGIENSAHNEKSFSQIHNGDMNAFLKAENLGQESHSPLLVQALAIQNAAFNVSGGRERIAQAIINAQVE